MAPKIIGFSSMDDFNRVRQSVARSETDVGSNRIPRAQSPVAPQNDVIGVWGDPSNDCPAFGIMLTNGAKQISTGWWVDQGKRPDTYGCQSNFLVATQQGVKTNAGGGAQAPSGFPPRFVVAYDSADGTPAAGELWGPRSGTFLAKKNTGGFRVIKAFDTTNHWMLAYSEPFTLFRGTADADIAAGAQGTVSIFYRSSGTAYTDTTVNESNVLNDLDVTVKSGSVVWCAFDAYMNSGTYTEGWVIRQSAFSC